MPSSFPLLSTLNDDTISLKELSFENLMQLCKEIRQRIIEVLAINGGHLASNLGVVELTVALHYVFSSPNDKFIFDVSHQTYPHKLLTKRHYAFETLRKFKGLCGFAHKEESMHDHFYAGHAGTALSLALGLCKDRDLRKGKEYILPIIGDAALTCGLTLEALNNIPKDLQNCIVILNDNAMSISKNVGAITSILSRILNSPKSNKFYQGIEALAAKIPHFGRQLARQGHRLTESLKNLVSDAPFFEEFGLSYVGPIDGHNLKALIDLFQELKTMKGAHIVHLLTNKGEGMEIASCNPDTYHGVKPFDKRTGHFLTAPSKKPTFPELFGSYLIKKASFDPELVVITPAMLQGSSLTEFSEKYPDRTIDTGIAEGHAVTFAGALAASKRPVVCSIYATFLQRALDNLFHDVCLQESPVLFAIDRASLSAPDGSTHHGIYDLSFLLTMPNLIVCQPRNGQLLEELLETLLKAPRTSPQAIRYPNFETEKAIYPLKEREIGKAEILKTGKELLIIALGTMNHTAMEVVNKLAAQEIQATLVDPIFLKPFDHELFERLLLTHDKVVTIEEHSLTGGLGSLVNNFLVSSGINQVSVINCGIPALFPPHGSYKEILHEVGLTADQIYTKIIESFYPLHDHRPLHQSLQR